MTHRIVPADPFTIRIPEAEVQDLKRRLRATRFPNEPLGNESWEYGTNLAYMERLIEYWRDDFDWRKAEENLNRFPQFLATLTDADAEDHTIHFLYERGSGDNAIP
ncbi:MAG: epoxide hydrolase N-terminal domain-containing protein, partial [Parvibaculum sp.]|nr:epoxide hydrolase N-terminal domain-containing protein [Parvibaculum sp.]